MCATVCVQRIRSIIIYSDPNGHKMYVSVTTTFGLFHEAIQTNPSRRWLNSLHTLCHTINQICANWWLPPAGSLAALAAWLRCAVVLSWECDVPWRCGTVAMVRQRVGQCRSRRTAVERMPFKTAPATSSSHRASNNELVFSFKSFLSSTSNGRCSLLPP